MLSATDILAIHDLISLYGHVIDERQFSRVGELFTDDAVYDLSNFRSGVHVGPEAVRAMWVAVEGKHPLAHHATNVMVSQDADGTVRVLSKGLGLLPEGRMGSVVYEDIVRLTPSGWRIAKRVARLRSPSTIPKPS